MNFDRNTVIGFVVLALLFFGYFYYTNKQQSNYLAEKARQDSIAKAASPRPDSITLRRDSLLTDSQNRVARAGNYNQALNGTESITILENQVFRVGFSNKGAQPEWVELKHFNDQQGKPIRMAASGFDKLDYPIITGENKSDRIANLFFTAPQVEMLADSSQRIRYVLAGDSSGPTLAHSFIIHPSQYLIDFKIEVAGTDKLFTQGIVNLTWQYRAPQQEKDVTFEKQNTQIGYMEDGAFDYHTIAKRSDKEWEDPVKWVGVRQQFFNAFLAAPNNFSSGKINWRVPPDEEKVIVDATVQLRAQLQPAVTDTLHLQLFYGPADYRILKDHDYDFQKLVNLGQGFYAFVRPLNRFIIMPIFNFLGSLVSNYGLVILFLTFIIRLLISPLSYSSYLSGAKMKVLRPEIAKLKEKYGNDQQQMSMEQMKLFREAGVNPLGGCIPALLQIPIFFALFSFFNSNVTLRQKNFLWADDLSAYDVIATLPFEISLYGEHVSLFTITACLTSFLISWYSMSMTPDQSNPVLKYMPYIFPFFLLFIFNRMPSALTWYYTVSNIVTLGLQFVIQTYIIDHDKILAKIEANRKKPKTKSKWQERLEQMQEQQKKMKEAQQKGRK